MTDAEGTRPAHTSSSYGTPLDDRDEPLDPSEWHDYLADPTLADAICDRIVHHAHRLVLKGPSRRKEKPAEKE